MLTKMLIDHCAPTLRGIKTANLFTFSFKSDKEADDELAIWNEKLNARGVWFLNLGKWGPRSIIYVYRKTMLQNDLNSPDVRDLLRRYGYDQFSLECCLEHLRGRIVTSQMFPHEIGLFLGYPVEDVEGFITNAGKNSKCIGLWKVYGDASSAITLFNKFKKCQKAYARIFAKQKWDISALTVMV